MARNKSPLTDRQRELARQQADLERRMRELQDLIEEAPRRKQAELERRRRMLLDRANRFGGPDLDIPASLNRRAYHAHVAPGPRMRSEQKAMRLRFIVLLIILGALTLLILSKINSI